MVPEDAYPGTLADPFVRYWRTVIRTTYDGIDRFQAEAVFKVLRRMAWDEGGWALEGRAHANAASGICARDALKTASNGQ
ncbi:hypothetical protein D9M70_619890 [compost metagenome]